MSVFPPASQPGTNTSILGKIFFSLFLSAFFGAGLIFLIFISREIWTTAGAYSWPEHPCVITKSEVSNNTVSGGDQPYVFQIEYRYEIDGRNFSSTCYGIKPEKSSDWSKIEALARRYPVGSKTVCFANSSLPSEAILIHPDLWIGLFIFIPIIFILIGGVGIWAIWRNSPVKAKPLSEQTTRPFGRWIGIPFFGIFLVVGIGGTLFMGSSFWDMIRSNSWLEIPCKIESSRVLSHDSDDGATYSIDILYQYSYRGRTYHSNRYSFMSGGSSGYKGKAAIVKKFPPGSNTLCYLDPANPSQAVLNRGWTAEMFLILAPLFFAAIGVVGILSILKAKSPNSAVFGTPSGRTPIKSNPINFSSPGEPLVMKPKTSAFAKMCGMFLFALFWNGIISIFVYQAWDSWNRGHSDWFFMLFLIPFVAVGLVLIGSVFYFMLCIANPTVKLALNSSNATLGEQLRLGWGFDGKTDRIQNLSITLEAREEATYRRGTRTYTDKNVFFRQILIDVSDSRQIAQGLTEAEIPDDLVPSFSSGNNRIVWTLTLHGSIQRWPDVKEEFEINVLPARRIA